MSKKSRAKKDRRLNGSFNNNNNNNNFWTRSRLLVAAGVIALPLGIIGAVKLLEPKKHDVPIQSKPLENIVDSDDVAQRLMLDGFYTNNIWVRTQIKPQLVDLIKKQIADPGLEMKVKVRDFMKFNIFNYYDFVLDQKRAEDETYARFSKALTDIVNELPNIDPAFDRFLEGRNGNVEMDLLELNKILQPYFETLGYVCMITPDLEEGIKRPNMILMETSDIKTFEVNCLNQTHVMKYRDVIGVAIPLIQGYKTPGNETEGMVIGEKDKDTICLIDTVRVKRIAESAWDTMQDGTNEYAPLLRRIFPTISKEGFISAYAELHYKSTLVHEATHDLRRKQPNEKSWPEEELVAFLNETIDGPSAIYTMLHLLRNGVAPYYQFALARFKEHVLKNDDPKNISDDALRQRSKEYLKQILSQ